MFFFWSEEAETAFLKSKKAFVKAATCSYLKFEITLKLYYDTWADTFAAVLTKNLNGEYETLFEYFLKRNPERKKFIPWLI